MNNTMDYTDDNEVLDDDPKKEAAYKESKAERTLRRLGNKVITKTGKLFGMHFPQTVVKYNLTDGELMMMDSATRADLEFYLLGYDVDKLQSIGDGLASVSEIIKGGFKGGFNPKKHGWKKVLQKIALLILTITLLAGIILMSVAVITIIVITIIGAKAPPSLLNVREAMFYYLAYVLIVIIFFGTILILYNMINARIFEVDTALTPT